MMVIPTASFQQISCKPGLMNRAESDLRIQCRMQRGLSTGGDVLCHSPWRHGVCLLQGSQALQACLHVYETICQPTQQSDPLIQP